MANPEHVDKLKDALEWESFRLTSKVVPDLRNVKLWSLILPGFDLSGADFTGSMLIRASFSRTRLIGAQFVGCQLVECEVNESDFIRANFSGAHIRDTRFEETPFTDALLTGAEISDVSFRHCDLTGTDMSDAKIRSARFTRAHLNNVTVTNATLERTVVDHSFLRNVTGLETVTMLDENVVDWSTINDSYDLPRVFLNGFGWPDDVLNYSLPLKTKVISFHSVFISHSAADAEFVRQLTSSFRHAAVRYWCAPESLRPGDHLRQAVDVAITSYDKLVVVLSRASLSSAWVEAEVEAALERERRTGELLILPLSLDDAAFEANFGWPAFLKRTRHIADFRKWQSSAAYRDEASVLCRTLRR